LRAKLDIILPAFRILFILHSKLKFSFFSGFDRDGYGIEGYNRDGYNRFGIDRQGQINLSWRQQNGINRQCLNDEGMPNSDQYLYRGGSGVWGKRGRRAVHIKIHGQFQRFFQNFPVNFKDFFQITGCALPASTGSTPAL
jgi:hypothetical protein